MNLKKIKIISENNKITLTSLANRINMSYQNLNRCIRENKMQAQDLEKIASILNVPISYFFDESGTAGIINGNENILGNNNKVRIESKDKEIEGLKRELALKDKIIKMLEERE